MKQFLWLVILVCAGCSQTPEKTKTPSIELQKAMAYGRVTHLNEAETNFDKNLLVRLYEVPQFGGDCFIETHGVCRNVYYVSVSTFDSYPEANVFKLKTEGEITDTKWLEDKRVDHAKIALTFSDYTYEALQNNPALKDSPATVTITVTPDLLVETESD